MSTTSFLAARTKSGDIGVESSSIARVVPAREWDGLPAIDLELLSFGEATEDTAVHIIVVKTQAGERALATSRALVLRDCSSRDVQVLPSELWEEDTQPIVSHVLCEDGQPPLLILSARALGQDQLPIPSGDTP